GRAAHPQLRDLGAVSRDCARVKSGPQTAPVGERPGHIRNRAGELRGKLRVAKRNTRAQACEKRPKRTICTRERLLPYMESPECVQGVDAREGRPPCDAQLVRR